MNIRRRNVLHFDDRVAIGVGIVTCIAILTALMYVGFNPFEPVYQLNNLVVYGSAWVFILGTLFLVELARKRPDSPLSYLRHDFFDASRRLAARRALYYSVLLSVFGTLFSLGKRAIPLFNHYSWDATLITWDQAIHGQDAWRILQPILGQPTITSALSLLYQIWVLLIYVGNFYFIFFERDHKARARYVAAYILTWTLVGLVAATVFASVGPCFLEPIEGDDHFAPLMSYLYDAQRQYPVQMLQIQERLLEWYFRETATLGAGISAMHSMHVAQAFLISLATLRKPIWISTGFALFALLILMASVHLGLHYAVDGYVAIAMTAAIWIATGRLFKVLPSARNSASESVDDASSMPASVAMKP